ncbi:unnamed protein product [Urochloa humidicola]
MEAGRGQGAHGHDRVAVEAVEGEEEEEVACECCGFTEECTAPYIARVRSRYGGRWICGLCGDAVGEELGRASPPISPAEALDRHACVCRRASAPPSPAGSPDDLIAALRLLLRRRLLGSPPEPRRVRSTPSSPRRDTHPLPTIAASAVAAVATAGGAGTSLARTGSCFAALVE